MDDLQRLLAVPFFVGSQLGHGREAGSAACHRSDGCHPPHLPRYRMTAPLFMWTTCLARIKMPRKVVVLRAEARVISTGARRNSAVLVATVH